MFLANRLKGAPNKAPIPTDGLQIELLLDDLSNTGSVGDDAVLAGSGFLDSSLPIAGHNSLKCSSVAANTDSHGIYIPNTASVSFSTTFTASIWIYRPANWNPSNQQYVSVFSKGTIYSSQPTLCVYERSASNAAFFSGMLGTGPAFSPLSQFTGAWHNIILENDIAADTKNIYMDNTLWGETTANTSSGGTNLIRLGYDTGNERTWYGNLGLFRVWNRLLTADEKSSVYAEVE